MSTDSAERFANLDLDEEKPPAAISGDLERVTYAMLRETGKYENDRVEIALKPRPGEQPEETIRRAKALCELALGLDRSRPTATATPPRPPLRRGPSPRRACSPMGHREDCIGLCGYSTEGEDYS